MQTRLVIRTRFLRRPLVVAQVAERQPVNFDPRHDHTPRRFVTQWRDARPDDFSLVPAEAE